MTRALTSIDGVEAQFNINWPINTLCQLSNVGNGGETTYAWSILDQPPGANDSLSNASVVNPTFTPRKEGSYLINLIVNAGQGDEARTTALVGVKHLKSGIRIPAAGEQAEAGVRGHAASVNEILELVDRLRADNGLMVARASSALNRNTVVRFAAPTTLKQGLPGQESILAVEIAQANAGYILVDPLGLCLGSLNGSGASVSAGELCLVRMFGLVTNCGLGGTAQALVYVNNAGALSLTPGSNSRRVGKLLTTSQDLLFWGYHSA